MFSHFLSKHSWETHRTLRTKTSKLNTSEYTLCTVVLLVVQVVLLLNFSTGLLIHSAYLVAFFSMIAVIPPRTLMDQISECYATSEAMPIKTPHYIFYRQ